MLAASMHHCRGRPVPEIHFAVLLQFAAVAAIAVRYARMPQGTGRQQIRWALLGFAASTASLAAVAIVQFAENATSDLATLAWLYIISVI